MHELSIAMEIMDVVEREALEHGAEKVTSVHLRIGDLAGVQIESLSFCFETICGEKSLTKDARLIIDRIPVKIFCRPCDSEFAGEGFLVRCPSCDGLDTELLQGEELSIAEIEVD
ncbi:hydrogenase maturation nickel metallochaperone HypA [bacterium]|nr:MAG: hydrogenase maturation nickel metallochaperone HypA [bacterium]